ncbi:MAG: nucleotidyltransferase domain-containing protein [Planctomycetales bacterium]|nr:nucleotidyltransferase domain-containing protein [Planctomycetales bacterium]
MSFSSFAQLKEQTGEEWPTITKAIESAAHHASALRELVAESQPSNDTSVIAFGSLARGEWTSGSDVDWTLLIDGPSDMRHFDVTRLIEDRLLESGYAKPGPSGTFGSMSSSHQLVHYIGGVEDTNQNLTRRTLLLLESIPLSAAETYDRIFTSILERYVLGDPPATTPGSLHVPLFLLNDMVRFWRTMAVDYATKKWQRSNQGWALRNIKLRMSRKLLFAKGMLMCFLCDRTFAGQAQSNSADDVEREVLELCKKFALQPPIDLLCHAMLRFASIETAKKTITSYDNFLAVLDDPDRRNELKNLPFEQTDEGAFADLRFVARDFRDGINELFFESSEELTKMTQRYGVF